MEPVELSDMLKAIRQNMCNPEYKTEDFIRVLRHLYRLYDIVLH